MTPWTQRVVLQWRPELRYYEMRTQIFRDLEDRGVLNAFRVTNDEVSGLLLGGGCELIVKRDELDLMINTPALDAQKCWELAVLAIEAIRPSRPTGVEVLMHHIVGLDLERDPAIKNGLQRLFRLPKFSNNVSIRDWAVLCDLHVEGDDSSGREQMEYGVLARGELPMRLQRNVGRTRRTQRPVSVQPDLDLQVFPPVALFVDSFWASLYAGSGSFVDTTLEFWARSRDRADGVVEALHTGIVGEQKELTG